MIFLKKRKKGKTSIHLSFVSKRHCAKGNHETKKEVERIFLYINKTLLTYNKIIKIFKEIKYKYAPYSSYHQPDNKPNTSSYGNMG